MRDPVDVIIPFSGSATALTELVGRLRTLEIGPEDSLTVVDNSSRPVADCVRNPESLRTIGAYERRSSYYARNRGADGGHGTWLLFLDADVDPAADLIQRYLAVKPEAGTGVLVGSVRDVRSGDEQWESMASRYSRLRRLIDQRNTLQVDQPYAKTANCVVRRAAFEQVGGFAANIRSGGDADLCFRLRDAGWGCELRPDAAVEHRSRRRVGGLLAQRCRHGSGAEWLERRYAGFAGPRRGMLGVGRNIVGGVLRSVASRWRGEADAAIVQLLDPLSNAAFEIGRRIPNQAWLGPSARPAPPRRWMSAVRRSHGIAK